MAAAAELAGVTRTTVYRHWETAADFTDDLVRYFVMVRPGWPQRLLGTDPDLAIEDALRQALRPTDPAPVVRAIVSAWPTDRPVRQELARWERSMLAHLAAWIDERVRRRGRTYPEGTNATSTAVALTAMMDGQYVLLSWFGGPGLVGWTEMIDRTDYRPRNRRLILDTFPAADPPVDRPPLPTPDPLPTVELSEAKRRILEAVAEAATRPELANPDGPSPGRVADPARLARTLGVTERRIYAVWPTAAELNQDVVDAIVTRARADATAYSARALQVCLSQAFDGYDPLVISALGAFIDSALERAPFTYFSVVLALADEAVRQSSLAPISEWIQAQSTGFLAMMAATGWRLADDLTLEDFTLILFGLIMGLQRLGALHPELATRTIVVREREYPMLSALAYHAIMPAITDTPLVRPSPGEAPPAPPITGE